LRDDPGPALALTAGDPSGIGPEVAIKAWLGRTENRLPPFYLLTDPAFVAGRARRLGLSLTIKEVEPGSAISAFGHALPIVPLTARFGDTPGIPDTANAAGVIEAIERAVADTFEGSAAAIVTPPIAKKPLYDAGFGFPGHTEYLAELSRRHTGRAETPVMMLAGPDLRAVPVTIHIALSQVAIQLSMEMIVACARTTAAALRERFGIAHPRLAVAGLNPHAGEGGALGSEDNAVVRPAVEQLCSEGIAAVGPLPADTMFHAAARRGYDAAICMYHDQALIPAKALAFDETVNVTLGLPFVRTSPDHGTAFDIAARGIARPDSLIAAIRLAARLSSPALAEA